MSERVMSPSGIAETKPVGVRTRLQLPAIPAEVDFTSAVMRKVL